MVVARTVDVVVMAGIMTSSELTAHMAESKNRPG